LSYIECFLFSSLAKLIVNIKWYLTFSYWPNLELLFKLVLVEILLSFLRGLIWYWWGWQLDLIFNWLRELWIIYLKITVLAYSLFPLFLIIKVDCFYSCLRFSATSQFSLTILLYPCLESAMILPVSFFQFNSSKILRICLCLEIKRKK